MEGAAVASHLLEDWRGGKAIAVARGQPLQHLGREARAEMIEVAEGAAEERREPEPEDGAHVPVARGAEDAVLQAARGFVQEREHEPLLDLALRERGARQAAGQERV